MTTIHHHLDPHQHSFQAMGCRMSIWLEHDDADEAGDALHSAEDLFCAAEQRFSRFLADSELTKLNEQSGQWVTVSRVMWQMLRRAHHLAEETSGLFDPTMLHSLEVAGYRNSFTEMQAGLNGAVTNLPHAAATQPTSLQGGWRAMAFDETNRTVRLPKGVKVDLGGIAKGATAQAAVDYLSHWGPCLVDAGGDLVAGDAPTKLPGWPVSVATPSSGHKSETAALQLWLVYGTLATSGVDYRQWSSEGQAAHHIIDPQTGASAKSDVVTVSVLSADAAQAEAWATAGLIAGIASGVQLFEDNGLAGAFIDAANRIRPTSQLAPFIRA